MPPEMKYFVLSPRAKDGYDMWARASQDAMSSYSKRIRTTDPLLADQLLSWIEKEKARQDRMLYETSVMYEDELPEDMSDGARCVCEKCGQSHNPKLIFGGIGKEMIE